MGFEFRYVSGRILMWFVCVVFIIYGTISSEIEGLWLNICIFVSIWCVVSVKLQCVTWCEYGMWLVYDDVWWCFLWNVCVIYVCIWYYVLVDLMNIYELNDAFVFDVSKWGICVCMLVYVCIYCVLFKIGHKTLWPSG